MHISVVVATLFCVIHWKNVRWNSDTFEKYLILWSAWYEYCSSLILHGFHRKINVGLSASPISINLLFLINNWPRAIKATHEFQQINQSTSPGPVLLAALNLNRVSSNTPAGNYLQLHRQELFTAFLRFHPLSPSMPNIIAQSMHTKNPINILDLEN